ncbi:MAG: thiamine pyrophosphate-dependent enzyme, partial [Polyangiales bacterium]
MIREGTYPASLWETEAPLPTTAERYDDVDARRSNAIPLTPQRWRVDLEEALPDDAIIFSDIGGHMLFNIHDLCMRAEQEFFINLGFGSMGHGTLAPIGAALAVPNRPVFAIVGDGCFSMNGMDLLTAAEYDVPVIWIVENNNMHGITWHCSKILNKGKGMAAARYNKH